MAFFTAENINDIKNSITSKENKRVCEEAEIDEIINKIKPALMTVAKCVRDAYYEIPNVSRNMGIAGNVKWFSYKTNVTATIPDPTRAYGLFGKFRKVSTSVFCEFVFL